MGVFKVVIALRELSLRHYAFRLDQYLDILLLFKAERPPIWESRDIEAMASHIREQIDLLQSLKLPDRYEPLSERVGENLATILVPPSDAVLGQLRGIVSHVNSAEQGALVPLSGDSGAGKTTLSFSVNQWLATDFGPTLKYEGAINFDALKGAMDCFRRELPANEGRVIPINIDHRESDPPKPEEMSALKRFLRTSPCGVRNVIFWPETTQEIAVRIGDDYERIAGRQPIKFLRVSGPPREAWKEIAASTMVLSNRIENLDAVGVNPDTYDPNQFPSLGEFIRRIQRDFNDLLHQLRASLSKSIVLAIVFVSESNDPGILSSLCNSSRYGLLDAGGLLAATPESVIGRWWHGRRGLLVRMIIQLNAHALFLPPAISVSALRNCGPTPDEFLDAMGLTRFGPGRAARDLERSDLAKLVSGEPLKRYEGRGNPAHDATAAFQLLADRGFNLGKDKKLNVIMGSAWSEFLTRNEIEYSEVLVEKELGFCNIIPDNTIMYADAAFCIEYTWRKGEFLSSTNRSAVAQYILDKLRNYARELGWSAD